MPLSRTLIFLLLVVAPLGSAELRTLKGQVIQGKLDALSDKELSFTDKDSKQVKLLIPEVLQLDLAPIGRLPSESKIIDVELIDGTLLHCSAFSIKKNRAELTLLLTGQKIDIPLAIVHNVLSEAQVEKYRREWTQRVATRPRKDVIATLRDGNVTGLEGTLGLGDEMGQKIEFFLGQNRKVEVPLANAHGLIFVREIDPNAPPVLFKLSTINTDSILASSATLNGETLAVTTPAGAKFEFALPQLTRLDYSKGKLAFLSDLEPSRVVQTSTEDRVDVFRRDRNLDDSGPLRIKGVTYAKGLAIHAYAELEYDLNGEYREFKAVAGIDDAVGGIEGPTILRIEGDGKELLKLTLTRKDKIRAYPIALNIKDVNKLRIIVSSGDLLDLGKHLDLADAQVSK